MATPADREKAVRIRHLGIVVQDLERTAEFYENVLGFKRLGDARTPGHYPGKALDLSDGEVNYSLLQPNPEIERSEWTYGAMGPNHIGVTIEDTAAVVRALTDRGVEVYGADAADPPRFFKFRDPEADGRGRDRPPHRDDGLAQRRARRHVRGAAGARRHLSRPCASR